MNGGRSVWLFVVLAAWLAGCDVDSGVNGAPDAGRDAATDMIVNADNNLFPCLNPRPAEDWGHSYVECDNGLIIRPQPVRCAPTMGTEPDECVQDSDCAGRTFCRCGFGAAATAWQYPQNVCNGANEDDCVDDRDCAAGFHCGYVTIGWSDWAIGHMRCQRPADECVKSEDCLASDQDAGVLNQLAGSLCQASDSGRVCCDPAGTCP